VQAKSEYSDVRVKIYDRDIQLAGQTAHATETPFYYPGDQTIYLTDDSIKTRIRGYLKKDVEWAFVLAHETGHHVQFQMGLLQMLMQNRDDVELNTRLELQADCLAGYWIGHNRELFGMFEVYEPGRLAGRVGSRNHGTSSQRRRWYLRGFKASSISQCNTLSVPLERL
jgi:uncharacterized protein